MPAVHKIARSTKTDLFGTFSLFFHSSMDLWYYLLQPQEKKEEIKMVLFYLSQQNISDKLHLGSAISNYIFLFLHNKWNIEEIRQYNTESNTSKP